MAKKSGPNGHDIVSSRNEEIKPWIKCITGSIDENVF